MPTTRALTGAIISNDNSSRSETQVLLSGMDTVLGIQYNVHIVLVASCCVLVYHCRYLSSVIPFHFNESKSPDRSICTCCDRSYSPSSWISCHASWRCWLFVHVTGGITQSVRPNHIHDDNQSPTSVETVADDGCVGASAVRGLQDFLLLCGTFASPLCTLEDSFFGLGGGESIFTHKQKSYFFCHKSIEKLSTSVFCQNICLFVCLFVL